MDVSSVSGGTASLQAVQQNPANNVAGGVEESTEKTAGASGQANRAEESQEGSQQAVQASAKESGVGGNVNIQV